MCLNLNNDWVACLTQDLLKQQPSNTISPVTDQNSESKYMNTAVCIFLPNHSSHSFFIPFGQEKTVGAVVWEENVDCIFLPNHSSHSFFIPFGQ